MSDVLLAALLAQGGLAITAEDAEARTLSYHYPGGRIALRLVLKNEGSEPVLLPVAQWYDWTKVFPHPIACGGESYVFLTILNADGDTVRFAGNHTSVDPPASSYEVKPLPPGDSLIVYYWVIGGGCRYYFYEPGTYRVVALNTHASNGRRSFPMSAEIRIKEPSAAEVAAYKAYNESKRLRRDVMAPGHFEKSIDAALRFAEAHPRSPYARVVVEQVLNWVTTFANGPAADLPVPYKKRLIETALRLGPELIPLTYQWVHTEDNVWVWLQRHAPEVYESYREKWIPKSPTVRDWMEIEDGMETKTWPEMGLEGWTK